jgi:hypothetical protein
MTESVSPSRLLRWLALPVLLVVVALAYRPGLDGGFVFDDTRNIVSNPALQVRADASWAQWRAAAFSSPARDLPRPLAMLSFAANHAATGLDSRAMKATNVAIHLLNVLLVFACMRVLLRALPPAHASPGRDALVAYAVAAAWALHPINLMAVLYVVQRMESLAHTFVFAGLWMYLHGRLRQQAGGNGWAWILAGLGGGTVLGAMSKESAVLLPLYAALAEWIVLRGAGAQGRQPGLRRMFALGLVLPGLAAMAWTLQRFATARAYALRDFDVVERLLTEPRVVLDYLHWTVLPSLSTLSLYHDDYTVSRSLIDPPATALAIVGVAALAAAAVALRRRRPLLALGIAWFLAAQVLTAAWIPLELVYEHRNYFASFGVCLALADVLLRLPSAATLRRILALVFGLFVAVLATTTWLRAKEWDDPVHFALSEAQKRPDSPRATYALAAKLVLLSGYRAESRYAEGARLAINQAILASGDSVLAEQAALIFAARTGAPIDPAWWAGLEDGLRRQPFIADNQSAIASITNCAIARTCAFPPERMIGMYQAALARPNSGAMSLYGRYALEGLHDEQLALRLWRDAVATSPRYAQFRINLARLLTSLGRHDEARAQIEALRGLGKLGSHDAIADVLEAELAADQAARAAPAPPR